MTATNPYQAAKEGMLPKSVFAPAENDGGVPEWLNKRASVEASVGVPLRWPPAPKARFELFDAWHAVAMQLVERAPGRRFRLMAAARQVIRWDSGQILSTNAEMADRAGRCGEKTVSRDVAFYQRIGVFKLAFGWRRVRGKLVRTRCIRLSLPPDLDPGIVLPDMPFDMDTYGPDEWAADGAADMDTYGPGTMDTYGPISLEGNEAGGADAA